MFRIVCQSNLKEMGDVFRSWETGHGDKFPINGSRNKPGFNLWSSDNDIFMRLREITTNSGILTYYICPSDDRQPATIFSSLTHSNVSYFIGLDADETSPAMLLAGDRNLVTNGVPVVPGLVVIEKNTTVSWSTKMHNGSGNVALADGSVQQVNGANLQGYISRTGTNANRLAVP